MKWKAPALAAKLAAGLAVITSGLLLGVPSAYAVGGPGTGTGAAIVTMQDGLTRLNQGGSTTLWTLRVPQAASCSGDTATNNFHIYSYVVASSVDETTLTFNASGPVPPASGAVAFPLVDQFGNPFIAGNTAPQTGQVIGIPNDFNWSVFTVDGRNSTATLPLGTYHVGLACQNDNGGQHVLDKFWSATETFTGSTTDAAGEVWSTVPNPQVPESPLAVALPLSALGVLGVGAIVVRRRRRRDIPVAA